MTRYIIRRLLQAFPLLFIISVILFVLMQNMGDPLATMGGRTITRSADRERLTRQLGLDKPIYVQYLYWLIGNDWTKIDLDGDGVPKHQESAGRAARRFRHLPGEPRHTGDRSHLGSPAQYAAADADAEVVIIAGCTADRHLFGPAPVLLHGQRHHRADLFPVFHADLFHRPGRHVYLFASTFKALGLALPANRGHVRSSSWQNCRHRCSGTWSCR